MLGKLLKLLKYQHFHRFSSLPNSTKQTNKLFNNLKSKIKLVGPLTVHDYMRESLTNLELGYYMNKDVFGKSGDFTTSPEISQIFGELVAIWLLSEWQKIGSPKPLQLVELGPGRGTMMSDILRVFSRVGLAPSDFSVHLVEVSRELCRIQGENLCKTVTSCNEGLAYQTGVTNTGSNVYWHDTIHRVPDKFSLIIAHEFFDALPIHILKKTDKGWNEVLIDVDPSEDKFRFVLSNSSTPACVYAKYAKGRDYFEISPQSGVIIEAIAKKLEEFGGFALVIDYGHDGNKTDTFRGFREHKVVDPLLEPGLCDLTADVDFAFLKAVASDKLISFGPVPQQQFLKQLHIDVRLQVLLKNCKSEKTKEDILSGYHMIMDSDKMGECFQVCSFFPAVLDEYFKKFPVTGFVK